MVQQLTKLIQKKYFAAIFRPFLFLLLPWVILVSMETCTNKLSPEQRKAEKVQALKEKQARKEYESALKQHEKNQSKETKDMMKKTKKEAPGNTPLKPK